MINNNDKEQAETTQEEPSLMDSLEEEPQEGVEYIKPRLDMKLSPAKKQECRDIVLEIKKFGVNQRQLLFLIDLLVSELENMSHIKKIKNTIQECRTEQDESKIILE